MKTSSTCKKIMFSIIAVISVVANFSFGIQVAAADTTNSYHKKQLNLQVKSALAIDSKTGQVLYAKNADKILPIASMTKLITVYLTLIAIKNKQLSWNTKVKPTANIVKVANNPDYSNVPLYRGHQYTIRQLYQATLIESANGAAMSLGHAISGSQLAFVKEMRQQVKKWGITDAKIYTACGLPNGNVGTDAIHNVNKNAENTMSAKDMAIVSQKLLTEFPKVIKTTKVAKMAFKDGDKVTKMSNFNWMLKGLSQYDAYLKVDGLKTGTTDKAGACFVATTASQTPRIITVVMGARHQDGNDPARFVQTKKLLNYIYSAYQPVHFKSGTIFNTAKTIHVPNGKNLTINIALKQNAVIWDPTDGHQITTSVTKKEVNAPINKGQVITNYQFKSGKEKLLSIDSPLGMKLHAAAVTNDNKANFLIRIWRWIIGEK